ncbi:hypothetical protein HFD88_003136 [Aspergillus terreus]|nr:hypothetical protein HFD88_003136 [Aspergillus terreus]
MEPPRWDDDHNAGRRARELYRYFQPERSPQTPPSREDSPQTNPVSDASLPGPSPFTAAPPPITHIVPEDALVLGEANATLTSFAQLAALRLDVDRVLVSVSDRDSQFILAQATKSLVDPASQLSGDEEWDGWCRLSNRIWPMCRDTVALAPSFKAPDEAQFLIVNDLSQDDKYKSLPFVKAAPSYRFYAGTPLTTETNINIGCLFVLDTKRRDSWGDVEKSTLATLSALIMDYLKVSRQASEGRRAARLSRGLSCFVEGSSSFVDTPNPSYAGSSANVPSTPSLSHQKATHLSVGSLNSLDIPSRRSHSSDARSISSMSECRGDQAISSNPDTPLPDWWSGTREKGFDESHGHSWAFRRAANLLRESLELDSDGGVIFLEAGNSPMFDVETGSDCSIGETNPASVLAISTNEEPFAPGPGSKGLYPATNLDNGFLHELFRRYSKGKLWSFHRDGLLSSSDDEKPHRSRPKMTKQTEIARGTGKKWKTMENSLLNLYFPNATQVLFVPLWNAGNSQWFAGCFCWNTVETRVFNSSVELSSVMGFGSSIMAECSRVESLISDRQKGDFIGSISHELRSPLHGILAAAEFLGGTNLDDFQGSLLETINACGRTLLDTMNQVLDFSKIVSLERSWRQLKKNKNSTDVKSLDRFSAHLDTFVATDLAILAEEVVEGVCLGHAYSQRTTSSLEHPTQSTATTAARSQSLKTSRHNVEVEIDIAQNDWVYQTQPGALRRIIMNVFGNAMKYTDHGRVSLQLAVTEASDSRSRRAGIDELVTLTVSDTGRGISEEFLRGRLYTPFAQEDTLAVGTGLGLSIVRSLVRSLHGSIHINSQPGQGTTVKVSLPLSRSVHEDVFEDTLSPRSPSAAEKGAINESVLLRDTHAGRRVAILGMDPSEATSHPSWSVITRYVTEWYGLELVSLHSSSPADLVIADENALVEELQRPAPAFFPALLILCDRSVDYNTARAGFASLAGAINIIRRPCGPNKVARAILRCLASEDTSLAPAEPTKPPPSTLSLRPRNARSLPSDDSQSENKLSDGMGDLTADDSNTSASSSTHSQDVSDLPDPLPTIASPSSPVTLGPLDTFTQSEQAKAPRQARVLVVDDNSINLNLMLTFMKKRHLAALDAAQNGKLAVEAVERMQQGYDMIFMDMSMPVMNGFEATRAIRAIEKERDGCGPAIIIALTGLSSSRDESDALASGVDLFLTKPVSFKEVSRLLAEWEAGELRGRYSAEA